MKHRASDESIDPQQLRLLRSAVLAVSVLDDIDVTPREAGVRLDGSSPVVVGWHEVAEAVGEHPASGLVARRRLSVLLRLHRVVAEAGRSAPVVLRPAARLVALPLDHAAHPGPGWVQSVQLGLAVTCGIGVLGLTGDPDEVVPLPASVAEKAGVDTSQWWSTIAQHAEDMGALAVRRLQRDATSTSTGVRHVSATDSQAVVRPVGGVDALSLLTTSALRHHLAAEDGSGMRAVAVPMRSRAWYDLARVDPAYVAAAWSATTPWDRGLARPVLVTADELTMALAGGDTVRQSLADPARSAQLDRSVRYR